MRVVRRASLILSLVLIVAIAVGFVVRRSEVRTERDVRLATAAEIGAARLTSMIESIEVAATTGSDPAVVATAVAAAHPALGVCAIAGDAVACDGGGPVPGESLVDAHRAQERDVRHDQPEIVVYDSLLTIDVDGPVLSVIARGPADVVGVRSDAAVFATTVVPSADTIGGFAVDRGIRQTATPVAAGLYVVAAAPDAVELPVDEQRFYLIVFTLACILLVLAGITIVVEQRNLQERAAFDPLTKLPNRSEFERRAAEALASADRREEGACLLLFDLNGFKQINDTHGHHAGDEILKVVGSRLRKAVRDGDVVARWGGDEFVIVMPGIGDDEMAVRRANQLAEQVSGRTRVDGVGDALRVKVSVGVALWPLHGEELRDLVEAADQAMYEAKREGCTAQLAAVPRQVELAIATG